MKKLKNKMLFRSISLTATFLLVLTMLLVIMSYRNTLSTLEKTISQTAQLAATNVETRLAVSKAIMVEIGTIARLTNAEIPLVEKQAILNNKKETYPVIQHISMSYSDGIDLNGNNIKDKDYFIAAMEGKSFITDPFINADGKSMGFIISAPLWENGKSNTKIVGVVYSVLNGEFLSEITDTIKVGETGSTYMINSAFDVIAHKKRELVYSKDNSVKAAEQDKSLTEVAELEKRASAGETVFGQYTFHGVSKFMAATPVNINGWSIGVNVESSEYLQQTMFTGIVAVVVLLVAILFSVLFNIKFANSITKPIIEISDAAEQLSEGNLDLVITHKGNDELGALATSFNKTIDSLNTYIKDIARGCREISMGNFNIEPSVEFKGSFVEIASSISEIIVNLSKTMKEISISSEQVSAGAEQVSFGAQALSQGSTEQASSIEELSATMSEVSTQIHQNAENANLANQSAELAGLEI